MNPIELQLAQLMALRIKQKALQNLNNRTTEELNQTAKEIKKLSFELREQSPAFTMQVELFPLTEPTIDGWWLNPEIGSVEVTLNNKEQQ